MPTCRTCGTPWPDGQVRCLKDGSMLVSAVDLTEVSSTGGGAAAARVLAPSDYLAPGTRVGEYEIVQKIGEGGMGLVYGARHPLIGKRAAIKVIHRDLSGSTDASDRFVREAQAVNQIGHPNIVDVFGFGTLDDGRRFFVMEWLQGESLAERLRRPLMLGEALAILEAIAKALQAAHEAGVLHRDLKPDNVFLQERKGESPVVKILDFGLAKLSGGAGEALDTTRTGAVMGTPLYISPEQAKGDKVDSATDVYSLGAMAYQMFSGQVPFRSGSAVETMAMHISQVPLPLSRLAPTIPPQIEELVRDMLGKDPRRRPSMAAVRELIASMNVPDALIKRDSRPSQPLASPVADSAMELAATTATDTTPKVARSRLPFVLGGVVAIGIGVGVVVAASSSPDDPPAKVSAAQPSEPPATTAAAAPPSERAATTPTPTPPAPTPPAPTPPVPTPPAPAPTPPQPIEAPASTAGETAPATVKRAPKAKVGTVVITIAGPPRAKILVDDKVVAANTLTTTQTLPPGKHTVHARSKGHKPAVGTVQVVAGRTHNVKLTLVKKQRHVDGVKDPFEDDE